MAIGLAGGIIAATASNPAYGVVTALPTGIIEAGVINYAVFKNDAVAVPFGGSGFGVNDASEDNAGRGNALDDGFHLTLNGSAFKDSDGKVDIRPDATNLGSGGQLLTAEGKSSGLKVTAKVGMFAGAVNGERARVLYVLKNRGTTAKKVQAQYTNALGSDSDTIIELTSNGNSGLSTADSWVITSDDGTTDDDLVTRVVNTIAFGDRPHTYQFYSQALGQPAVADIFQVRFAFKIRPGKKAQLLFIHQFEDEVAFAENEAEPEFDTFAQLTAEGLTSGLSGKFVNWNTP